MDHVLDSSDQTPAHLQLFIFLLELLIFIRVAVRELVDFYPIFIYLFPQLEGQNTHLRDVMDSSRHTHTHKHKPSH